uniref:Bm8834 n=1 Tax=Brugia malayi TaxID=6279 RepID=A0A1U7F0J2_BRUMA|nr:Bm9444 [Brugia malayi]CDQ06817.1 Bm8834 [Brugia malayi]
MKNKLRSISSSAIKWKLGKKNQCHHWLMMMAIWKRRWMSEPFLNEEVISVAPPATVSDRREETVREIELRSRTIRVPMLEQDRNNEVPAGPVAFQVPSMEALPAHYRRALAAPEIDPYTVTRKVDGSTANDFCQKCDHFVKMPHAASTEVIEAVMEFHSMEWCPKVTKAVV